MTPIDLKAFWHALPAEGKALLALFVGATILAMRRNHTDLASGLKSVYVGLGAGGLLLALACWMGNLLLADVWFMAGILAFLSNWILSIAEKSAEQLESVAPGLIKQLAVAWLQKFLPSTSKPDNPDKP